MTALVNPVLLFQGTAAALKGAGDIAISLSKIKTLAEVQSKAVELNELILAAQSNALSTQADQFVLLERVRGLEKDLADIKAWEAEKQKYQLQQIGPGVFAHALKEQTGSSEPFHLICANCYENEKKSILQRTPKGFIHVLTCHGCSSELPEKTEEKKATPPAVHSTQHGSWMSF